MVKARRTGRRTGTYTLTDEEWETLDAFLYLSKQKRADYVSRLVSAAVKLAASDPQVQADLESLRNARARREAEGPQGPLRPSLHLVPPPDQHSSDGDDSAP